MKKNECTVFAWRYKQEYDRYYPVRWQMEAVLLDFEEAGQLWKKIHKGRLELRFISTEEPVFFDTGTTSAVTPLFHGWWQDPFEMDWIAPENYFICPEPSERYASFKIEYDTNQFEDHVLRFIAEDAHTEQKGEITYSDTVSDETQKIFRWLGELKTGKFLPLSIDDEGVDSHFFALPLSKIGEKFVKPTKSQKEKLFEFVAVDNRFTPSKLVFHGIFPRIEFVNKMYETLRFLDPNNGFADLAK